MELDPKVAHKLTPPLRDALSRREDDAALIAVLVFKAGIPAKLIREVQARWAEAGLDPAGSLKAVSVMGPAAAIARIAADPLVEQGMAIEEVTLVAPIQERRGHALGAWPPRVLH